MNHSDWFPHVYSSSGARLFDEMYTTAQVKTYILSLTRKQLGYLNFHGRKDNTPWYKSSQSFTHCMIFSNHKGIREMWRVGLIWLNLIHLLSQWYLIAAINIHCYHKYLFCLLYDGRVVNPVEKVLSPHRFYKWRRFINLESLDLNDKGICLVRIAWFSISNRYLNGCLTH